MTAEQRREAELGGVPTWPLEGAAAVDAADALRLLLIEDSPSDSQLIRELLEDELPHSRVDAVASLADAVRHLSTATFDVILSDLTLPDADGEQVVRTVRDTAPRTPLILLTGRADRQLALWSLAAGAQDYLVKGDHDGVRLADAVLRGLQRSLTEQQAHERLASALRLQGEAADRLRVLDAARSDFVATANHELRTPLACIAASAELLQDTSGLSEIQSDLVDAIMRNAARLGALTDDLLLLSSFSSEPAGVAPAEVDMCEVVSAATQRLAPLAEAKGVHLTARIPQGPLLVGGHPQQLERLVSNLLTNAIKFNPAPGAAACELTTGGDGEVAVIITDTGVGIPAEEQGKVFEKFFRGAWAHEHAVQGTGLGLHIAASIAERHGGRITLDSAEGGTTVSVRLPAFSRTTTARPAATPWPAEDPLSTQLFTLLALPEDDPEARKITARFEETVRAAHGDDQWQPVEDAIRFVRIRLHTSGPDEVDVEPLVALLTEAATRTPSSAGGASVFERGQWIADGRTMPDPAPGLGTAASAYLDRLLDGDDAGAMAVARRCAGHGMAATDVLVDVLEPAQREVGHLWESGLLTTDQERFATTVTHRVLNDLYAPAVEPQAPPRRLVALHAPGSLHRLGLRFITDLLEARGWVTTYALPDTAPDDLPSLLVEHAADLLLVSASMPEQVEPVRALIAAVREDPRTRTATILVGGRAFNLSPDLAESVGADGWARDARSALTLCDRLPGRVAAWSAR